LFHSSQIVNPGKFYFQPDQGRRNVEATREILAKGSRKLPNLKETIEDRRLLVKPDNQIKWGKIVEEEADEEHHFGIYLIDYLHMRGN
jgi:hypothetical protein